jgi:hypothetical protein
MATVHVRQRCRACVKRSAEERHVPVRAADTFLAGRIAHLKDEPVFVERDEINGSDAERIRPRNNVLVTVCVRRLALERIAALNDAKEYNRKSRSPGGCVSNPRA